MDTKYNPIAGTLRTGGSSSDGGGGGGTANYNDLENKPTLNGVEISGNKTSADYKISAQVTQVDHGTADTTFELPPNQYHTWREVASLTLTLGMGRRRVKGRIMETINQILAVCRCFETDHYSYTGCG